MGTSGSPRDARDAAAAHEASNEQTPVPYGGTMLHAAFRYMYSSSRPSLYCRSPSGRIARRFGPESRPPAANIDAVASSWHALSLRRAGLADEGGGHAMSPAATTKGSTARSPEAAPAPADVAIASAARERANRGRSVRTGPLVGRRAPGVC